MRTTTADFARMKAEGRPIPMVTCYDYASALIVARAGLRFILVGDSLGQVMLGHDDTLRVSLDEMISHSAAVVRGAPDALVIGDLPFLSYAMVDDAVRSAGRMMREAGVRAVKLEGGRSMAPIVRRMVELGIPVVGHLGFTPQSAHQIGIRVQGRTLETAADLIADAHALEQAGACAVVLELVPAPLAAAITKRLKVPTIGIGAGAGCSGQVQVWHDLLGLFDRPPFRHARQYAAIGPAIEEALRGYAGEVTAGVFPTAANAASMDEGLVAEAVARFEAAEGC
ncbi:3-methyl-2-oxobutanoate hydroxymethyltransferase [Sphingomonas oleivorans]|uniref:3-methyl-2-oxobutanoate hydroxymethyltransferase n=1 Tax=Sphingomonas oleivorans TaxID=1735121 RepID=A0A2T5FV63_9SPHN|nr:3-methyl-2-oxobutanoate hydroxymethyltransferase [Sphingomonas oleivorans]